MPAAAELSVLLRLDDQVSKALGDISARLRSTGEGMQRMGRDLTIGVTAPLAALGGISIKAAIDFESSFAGIRKTVDATEEQFADLAHGMRRMALEIPVNVNELNRIGEAAGQLGVKTENIVSFTKTMAELGVTTNLSADEAATALAQMANITGLSQSEFDRLGSTIVALGNTTATTESKIVDMGLRLALTGKQVGLTDAQILAFAASLSEVGIEAQAGGSAFSRAFITMAAAVDMGGDKLALFAETAGVTTTEFARLFREDAAGAMVAFTAGLGQVKEKGGSVFQVLEDLELGDIRVRDAMLAASTATDKFTKNLQTGSQAFAENTALTEEAEKRFATAASQLTLLKNRFQESAITLGTALIPVLKEGLAALQPVIAAVAAAVKWFSELNPGVQRATVIIAGLAAAFGPLLLIVGTFITTLASAISVLKGMAIGAGILQGVLAGPAGVAIALGAAAAAAAGLAIIWKTSMNDASKATAGLDASVRTLGQSMGTLSTSVPDLKEKIIQLVAAVPEAGLILIKKGMLISDLDKQSVEELTTLLKAMSRAGEKATITLEDLGKSAEETAFYVRVVGEVSRLSADQITALVRGSKKAFEDEAAAKKEATDKMLESLGLRTEANRRALEAELSRLEQVKQGWANLDIAVSDSVQEFKKSGLSIEQVIIGWAVVSGKTKTQLIADLAAQGWAVSDITSKWKEMGVPLSRIVVYYDQIASAAKRARDAQEEATKKDIDEMEAVQKAYEAKIKAQIAADDAAFAAWDRRNRQQAGMAGLLSAMIDYGQGPQQTFISGAQTGQQFYGGGRIISYEQPIMGGGTVTVRPTGMAAGGNVLEGGLAVVGERGRELLELPPAARVTPLGPSAGGLTVNITVQGDVLGVDDLDEHIVRSVRDAARQGGFRGVFS